MVIKVASGVVAFQVIVLRPDELALPPDRIYLQSPERYEFMDSTDITKRYVIALSTGLYAPIGTGGTGGTATLVGATDFRTAPLTDATLGNAPIVAAFAQTMLLVGNWDGTTPAIASSTPPPAGVSNTLVYTGAAPLTLPTSINGITVVKNGDVVQYSTFTGIWRQFSKLPVMQVSDLTDGAALLTSLNVQAINAQTGTTYTLVLADAGDAVDMNNPAANTLTIPANSAVPFPIGTVITVTQAGVGTTTIAGAGGVTLAKPAAGSYAISMLLQTATLFKVGTDIWRVNAT